jgi:hypothetical protein
MDRRVFVLPYHLFAHLMIGDNISYWVKLFLISGKYKIQHKLRLTYLIGALHLKLACLAKTQAVYTLTFLYLSAVIAFPNAHLFFILLSDYMMNYLHLPSQKRLTPQDLSLLVRLTSSPLSILPPI